MAEYFGSLMRPTLLTLGLLGLCSELGQTQAQIGAPQPPEVTWTPHLGEGIPLETSFVDSRGRTVQLADSFGERPVLLALVYYECPMLCNLVLQGLVRCLGRPSRAPPISCAVGE